MNQNTFDDKTRMTTPETPVSDGETQTLPKQTSAPRRDAQTQLLGMVLHDRYRIEKKLGDGGFGSVFLASDQRLMDKPVVVKILERSDNDWVWTKFQQEREALSRIEHPGVIGIQDAGELPDGQPFIVMQFVSGTTLRDVLDAGALPLSRIANITEQTAYALGAAHEKEILHRDLKPENIMLQPLAGEREQVKVIDFGIAKVKQSKVAESSTGLFSAGTLYYMPPESLQGKSYTAAGDVYVLAVLVYEMLTGRPFSPSTESPLLFASQLLELQKRGAAELIRSIRPDLPDAARNILLRALSFEPEERFQDVIEFGSKFAEAARHAQASSQPLAHTVFSTPAIQINIPPTSTMPLGEPAINLPLPAPQPAQKRKSFLFAGGLAAVFGLLIVAALVSIGAWYLNSSRQTTSGEQTAATNASQNSLRYWLNVQKMRDGKPFQEPFKSSGQEIFENGYKFQLNASSSQNGYLYFFNEGTGEQKDKFWILFPTPRRNDGLAKVGNNEDVQSGWNVFGGEAGTEKCWLIWTADENPILEDARKNAFGGKDGSLSGEPGEKLKKFIADNRKPSKTPRKDASNQQMIAESSDKILVNLLELEHR